MGGRGEGREGVLGRFVFFALCSLCRLFFFFDFVLVVFRWVLSIECVLGIVGSILYVLVNFVFVRKVLGFSCFEF